MAMEKLKQKRWLKLALYVAILVGLSFGFAYLLQYLMAYFNIPVERFASTAYLLVFGVTLVSNAAILVPVYIHVSIMMAVAKYWNPVLDSSGSQRSWCPGGNDWLLRRLLGKEIHTP